jgi:hypothetical protein
VIARSFAALLGFVVAFASACGSPAPAPAPAPLATTTTTTEPSTGPRPTTTERLADRDAAMASIARVAGTYTITDEALATLQLVGTSQATIDSVETLELTLASYTGIYLKPGGQPGIDLVSAPDGTFYNEHDDIRVSFELPASGHVSHIIVTQGPLVLRYAYVDGK